MSSRVRLLPTLIGAAGVLLFLRLGAMAADPAADADAGGDAATKEVTAPQVGAAAEDVAKPVAASPPAQPAPAMVVPSTKGEADVLQRLVERRAALDEREKNVGLREKMLSAAEKQVDARLSELKQLEQKLEALVSKRNEMEETQLSSLVKTYESMKPEDAARIFNRLERGILVDVAHRMKPAKIGAVLAAMEPARAQDLTVLLARRLKVTQGGHVSGAGDVASTSAPNG